MVADLFGIYGRHKTPSQIYDDMLERRILAQFNELKFEFNRRLIKKSIRLLGELEAGQTDLFCFGS